MPIIIVTDDVKEDWWWRHEGKIVGPSPELVDEIRSKAGVDFYMYVSDQFMEYAREYLNQQVDQGAIDEIREVRKLDEQRRLHAERLIARTEQRLHEFRHELLALDAEAVHLADEIGVLNQQLSEVSAQPVVVERSAERQELVSQLISRMHIIKERRNAVEEERHRITGRLALEMEQRDLRLHQGFGHERLVHMADGTIRRVARPLHRPIEGPAPASFTDIVRRKETAPRRGTEPKKSD